MGGRAPGATPPRSANVHLLILINLRILMEDQNHINLLVLVLVLMIKGMTFFSLVTRINLMTSCLTSNCKWHHDQWRIQDFPQGGAPTPKSAIIFQFFAENCMKMKEFGPPGGGARPWRPPLDPPMMMYPWRRVLSPIEGVIFTQPPREPRRLWKGKVLGAYEMAGF